MRSVRRIVVAAAALALLTACGSGDDDAAADPSPASQSEAPVDEDAQERETNEAPTPLEPTEVRTQAESCDWGTPAVSGGSAAPAGQDGDLKTVVVGAWQHTHFDTGSGWEALDSEDIRYVFPSATRMLYCQDVPGATHQAENAADIGWDGDRIAPPGSHPGFTVVAWSDDAMVWRNHTDDSTYLLKRR